MQVDKKVLKRIVQLKDHEGMGFRKIAMQLKEEGYTNLSKSTIATLYKKYTPKLREETEKERCENEKYQPLRKTKLKLAKEVNIFQAIEETHKKIKLLLLEKATTSEGIKDVFSSPEKMLEFTQGTVDNYRSVVLKNPDVFESLVAHCKKNNQPLAKTLFQIVGSLKDYEADVGNDGTLLGLDNYVGLQIGFFLGDLQEEERRRDLQKKFTDNLYSVKCPDCGTKYEKMVIDTLNCELICLCNARLKLLCLNCKAELGFDSTKRVFCCPKCHMVFKRPS